MIALRPAAVASRLAARRGRIDPALVATAVAADLVVVAAAWRGLVALPLLLAVAVPLALLLCRRPQRGVLVLVALAPFDGVLAIADLPGFVAGWKEALTLATLAATLLAPSSARAAVRRSPPGFLLAVVGLVALAAASVVAAQTPQALQGLKVDWFYALAFVALWRCPFDARERRHLVSVLMVTGVVVSLVGIAQQVVGHERLAELGYPYDETIRFSGDLLRSFSTFDQPFPFAYHVLVVLLVGGTAALAAPGERRSRLFLLAVPVLLAGIATPLVRGAWLGLAVGVAYLGATRHRGLLLLVPLGLAGLLVLPGEVAAPVLSSYSTGERTSGWADNVGQVVERPFGSGAGSVGAVADRLEQEGELDDAYQPDNQYLVTAFQLGIPGLWLLLLFLVGAALLTTRTARRLDGPDGALAAGVAAMVLAVAAISVIATYLQIFPVDLLFWVLLAVVARLGDDQPASTATAGDATGRRTSRAPASP